MKRAITGTLSVACEARVVEKIELDGPAGNAAAQVDAVLFDFGQVFDGPNVAWIVTDIGSQCGSAAISVGERQAGRHVACP